MNSKVSSKGSRGRPLGITGWPYHPYFLALHYLVGTLALNLALVMPGDTHRALIVFLAGVTLLLCVCWLVLRRLQVAGLLCTAIIALMYLLPPLAILALETLPRRLAGATIPMALILLLIAAIFLVRQLARHADALTKVANAVGLGLLALPVYAVISAQSTSLPRSDQTEVERARSITARIDGDSVVMPDIYHIVLDAYMRADVMKEIYGFDNGAFIRELRDIGFFVADQARGNYTQTLLSLSATLSMRYLDEEFAEADAQAKQSLKLANDKANFRLAMMKRINNNALVNLLKVRGYRRIAVGTPYSPVLMTSADEIVRLPDQWPFCAFNMFEKLVFQQTLVEPLCNALSRNESFLSRIRDQSRFALETQILGQTTRPTFVFQHVLAPHPPFLFNADGSAAWPKYTFFGDGKGRVQDYRDRRIQYRRGYVEQVRYVNTAVLTQVRQLMASRERPLVIIIQGDHGSGVHLDHEEPNKTCMRERFSPLLAIYSSDARLKGALRPDLSLVNLYRVVLNRYFGTDLPMLESRQFYTRWSTPAEPIAIEPAALTFACPAGLDEEDGRQMSEYER